MARIKLSPPWVTYYNELNCLFKEDPDIIVIYDEENNEIKLCVDNNEKVCALSGILSPEKDFGTVTMKITVVPSNGFTKPDESKMQKIYTNPYAIAFEGNPILSYVKQIDTIIMGKITYVVFVNEVVQYFNDNLYDINGVCSTLYQEIAKEVFKESNSVHFCTDIADEIYVTLE